ncbi:hypothetical protein HID58_045811 [Brassica napus]|uniref:Uncharacterized protein n=1 Tax=Brassica napus TaxID=3708 RepID=A0ABQ8AVL2_BRANA|nr:hypothetical protein HID58_045811 [Brassica napus]
MDLYSNGSMEANTLNLYDDDYLSVEDMMAENEDDQEIDDAQGDSVTSDAKTRDEKEDEKEDEENEGETEEEEKEEEGGRRKKKIQNVCL